LQIQELYGKKEASGIIADCSFKIFFASNDCQTAQAISSLLIDANERKESFSWQQIMTLPVDSQIILLDKEQSILSKKMKYYDDKDLSSRIIDPVKI